MTLKGYARAAGGSFTGLLVSTAVVAAGHAAAPPSFSLYPATETLVGRPVPVDVASHPEGRKYRTVLREGTRAAPNFAGRYSLVLWGCGTECQTFAIVDRASGRIVDWGNSGFGVEFRVESRLLVVDPIDAANESLASRLGRRTRYYLLEKGSLTELRSN